MGNGPLYPAMPTPLSVTTWPTARPWAALVVMVAVVPDSVAVLMAVTPGAVTTGLNHCVMVLFIALRADCRLPTRVAGLELQGIFAVVAPLSVKVNEPPVIADPLTKLAVSVSFIDG